MARDHVASSQRRKPPPPDLVVVDDRGDTSGSLATPPCGSHNGQGTQIDGSLSPTAVVGFWRRSHRHVTDATTASRLISRWC